MKPLRTVLAVLVVLACAPTAHAGIFNVHPEDTDGPEASFTTNEELWAGGTNDTLSGVGEICIVNAGTPAEMGCQFSAFGKPNVIGTEGTYTERIEFPH